MSNQIESVMHESRKFFPSPEFKKTAHISSMEDYQRLHRQSLDEPEAFWSDVADELHWFKRWDKLFDDSEKPFYKWFVGAKTNICYNCVDRYMGTAVANKAAFIWEGEPGDTRTLTYRDLYREVQVFANVLKALGIRKGDAVAIYLPLVPDLAIAVLACARIGAVHNVIFAGFSADSIKDRITDSQSKLVITSDGGGRRGRIIALKDIVDDAVEGLDIVEKVLVCQRNAGQTPYPHRWNASRDVWYHQIAPTVPKHCPCEEMDAEDMLFLLYTSGSTGKPKGIVHSVAGYMVYAYLTTKYVFDIHPEDVYFCSADIGWVTGHSYVVYGPLQNAATVFLYEGAPNYPDNGRFWQMIEKYGITIFYTAPTAIRAFMRWGDEWVTKYDLSSLRLLGSVGEPINPEAWMWYHKLIGGERCPIVDTWWQTETGGIMLTPLPGVTPTKPGSATLPFFGVDADILDVEGNSVKAGLLAIKRPWPSMLRGVYGDPARFKDTYWSRWEGKYYFAGDGARKDEDGYFWVIGRVDDVVNVSGHRIGTAELESVFVEHPSVAESAVIGVAHELKGQGLVAFVLLRSGNKESDQLRKELNELVAKRIGKFALPEKIIFSADLPKTRSGKIMRRLLRDIAEGRALGNVTTLADPSIIDSLKGKYTEES
ncbi:MAG: acetate--CoA ligase [Verrucomicrobiota bacterium]|nr:acetate--CoA ligase [Verrucomicrobiota bacterium]